MTAMAISWVEQSSQETGELMTRIVQLLIQLQKMQISKQAVPKVSIYAKSFSKSRC
jgi:hypothetical protein